VLNVVPETVFHHPQCIYSFFPHMCVLVYSMAQLVEKLHWSRNIGVLFPMWSLGFSIELAAHSRFETGNRLPRDVTVLFKTFYFGLRRQVNVCSAHSAKSGLGLSA
jgi:hypothetical protein